VVFASVCLVKALFDKSQQRLYEQQRFTVNTLSQYDYYNVHPI
jgi:hypothetical protein